MCRSRGQRRQTFPPDISACDGNTIQASTVLVGSNGAVQLTPATRCTNSPARHWESNPTINPFATPPIRASSSSGQDQNDFTPPRSFLPLSALAQRRPQHPEARRYDSHISSFEHHTFERRWPVSTPATSQHRRRLERPAGRFGDPPEHRPAGWTVLWVAVFGLRPAGHRGSSGSAPGQLSRQAIR